MSGEFNSAYLASICTGLDVYRAKSRLFKMYPALSDSDIDIRYQESSVARFTVLACTYDEAQKRICLTVATSNPIRHLPLNYQSNVFLRNFLMVIQHTSVLAVMSAGTKVKILTLGKQATIDGITSN